MLANGNLPNPPIQSPFLIDGKINNQWILWFQDVYNAITDLQNAP
jgi:hypothetical protein